MYGLLGTIDSIRDAANQINKQHFRFSFCARFIVRWVVKWVDSRGPMHQKRMRKKGVELVVYVIDWLCITYICIYIHFFSAFTAVMRFLTWSHLNDELICRAIEWIYSIFLLVFILFNFDWDIDILWNKCVLLYMLLKGFVGINVSNAVIKYLIKMIYAYKI